MKRLSPVQATITGSFSYHGPVFVTVTDPGITEPPVIPQETRLLPPYPNPFNPSTTIRYELQTPERVSIAIYNSRGQLVYSYQQSHATAGAYSLVFNGVNQFGESLSSGLYLCLMKSGNYVSSTKLILLK